MPASDAYQVEVIRLRRENETLRAERDFYKDQAQPKLDLFPTSWRLSESETIVLEMIYRTPARAVASKEAIYDKLYGDHSEVSVEVLNAYICNLRRKLAPHRIEITTVWGRGYTLPDESRALIDSAVNGTLRFAPQPRADLHA